MRIIHRRGILAALFVFCNQCLGQQLPIAGGTDAPVAEKSASVQTLASRGIASIATPMYGGFSLANSSTVYLLVRGPSLRTLGVTQNALDAPWVRLFNASGADIVTTGGTTVGFSSCDASASTDAPVVNYYQTVRNAPVNARDSCIALSLPAGTYTFSVVASVPGSTSPSGGIVSFPSNGEILFEVTLGPPAPVEDNRAKTERLIGGTWSFTYTIISTFTDRYTFTSVQAGSNGEWLALGTGQFGDPAAGMYVPSANQWAVLDPGIIIDQFYTFTFSDLNHVSGCYYQINPPGSTNLSRCYSMFGSRSPPKLLEKVRVDGPTSAIVTDSDAAALYHRLRNALPMQ